MTDATAIERKPAVAWTLRNGYDFAEIFVRHGQRRDRSGPNTWVAVSIVSSYGDWGYFWSNCGHRPWWCFLADLNRQYAMEKFMGAGYRPASVEATLNGMRANLIERRREGCLSAEDAREAWDVLALCDGGGSLDAVMHTASVTRAFGDCYFDMVRTEVSPHAIGFWERFWTPWVAHLRETEGGADA